MRLLALVSDAFGGTGGIARFNRDFLTALIRRDDISEIDVLPRIGTNAWQQPKLRQSVAPSSRLSFVLQSRKIATLVRPQIIFCGHLNLLPVAAWLANTHRARLWLHLHGMEAWHRSSATLQHSLTNVHLVSCASRFTREKFLLWADFSPENVKILPNTVSDAFRPLPKMPCKRDFHWQDQVVLLTVGRLDAREAYKGQDRVIHCLPALIDAVPHLIYAIAGCGSDRQRLERLARAHGVADRVEFLGDIPAERLNALYAAADLFVMPSTGEGFGIVFLEAMASGTLALGFGEDGSLDALRDGTLGILSSRETLGRDILNALQGSAPGKGASRVENVFGRPLFERHIGLLLRHITRLADPWEHASCAG